ncbi:hypothetical protein [Falsirhodobacter halotolerans]|uniref:hypothetical protein n=1 Tax=Falsirhodobacter halotolerans TaxID=1146892 RepID=UPI001FCFA638|nr:hypothetical protein [Falsirhodobacter halotolerans]MCJ8138577.1 hypothetical protein [Falsirhodobacter halotolerans]
MSALLGAASGPFLKNFIEGWFARGIRFRANNQAMVDEACEHLDIVLEEAFSYWNSSAADLGKHDTIYAARITMRLHHVSHLIAQRFESHPKVSVSLAQKISDLMSYATGGTFGEPDREAEPRLLSAIGQSVLSLEREIKRCGRENR